MRIILFSFDLSSRSKTIFNTNTNKNIEVILSKLYFVFVSYEITGEDILSVMPYNNTIDKIVLNGSGLRNVLEGFGLKMCPGKSFDLLCSQLIECVSGL